MAPGWLQQKTQLDFTVWVMTQPAYDNPYYEPRLRLIREDESVRPTMVMTMQAKRRAA